VADPSSGNRQKIGLIQALMNEPPLVIMDEPSTGLDPLVQHEFQRVADRVAIIRSGRLVAVEGLDELRTPRRGRDTLGRLYRPRTRDRRLIGLCCFETPLSW